MAPFSWSFWFCNYISAALSSSHERLAVFSSSATQFSNLSGTKIDQEVQLCRLYQILLCVALWLLGHSWIHRVDIYLYKNYFRKYVLCTVTGVFSFFLLSSNFIIRTRWTIASSHRRIKMCSTPFLLPLKDE